MPRKFIFQTSSLFVRTLCALLLVFMCAILMFVSSGDTRERERGAQLAAAREYAFFAAVSAQFFADSVRDFTSRFLAFPRFLPAKPPLVFLPRLLLLSRSLSPRRHVPRCSSTHHLAGHRRSSGRKSPRKTAFAPPSHDAHTRAHPRPQRTLVKPRARARNARAAGRTLDENARHPRAPLLTSHKKQCVSRGTKYIRKSMLLVTCT